MISSFIYGQETKAEQVKPSTANAPKAAEKPKKKNNGGSP